MELEDFTRVIARMSTDDIHRVAAEIDAHRTSAADDLAWWAATIEIDRSIRTNGCSRVAAMGALAASRAVQAVAATAGVPLPDAEVTTVARAAAEVARGIAAHADGALGVLLASWRPVFVAA
jgi:hypothetical protein